MRYLLIFIFFIIFLNISAEDKHFGSKNCSQCHQKQYDKWKKSPHAKADAKLTEKQKKNPACMGCHKPSNQEAGVGCESCHGEGKYYSRSYVMKDKKLSKILGLKKIKKESCKKCHNKHSMPTKEFDYEKNVKDICKDEK